MALSGRRFIPKTDETPRASVSNVREGSRSGDVLKSNTKVI
jgi:hypothetical protein